MKIRAAGLAALTLLCVLSSPLRAQPLSGEESQKVFDSWLDDLREAEKILQGEGWKKAEKLLSRRLAEMASRIRSGPTESELLASALALRAIARAGLGKTDEATWDWQVALSLMPGIETIDRSRYGEAGALFSGVEPASVEAKRRMAESLESVAPSVGSDDKLIPVKKVWARPPSYPRAKQNACHEGPIHLSMVIDLEGRTRAPSWDRSGDPVLAFWALETVREWKFKPARLNGEPIVVRYNLTVNYRLQLCGGRPGETMN